MEESMGKAYIPCTLKMKQAYALFRNSEKAVADYILLDNTALLSVSLAQAAEKIGVSEASVMRFCKLLGYSGFREMKMMLAREAGETSGNGFDQKDTLIEQTEQLKDIPHKVAARTIGAITDTLKIFDQEAYEQAIEAICHAKRVDIYGVANSYCVGDDARNKLMRLGILCNVYADAHLQITAAASLQKGDVAIGISHSGMTKDTVNALRLAREKGATTVCITNCSGSCITEVSDIPLLTAFYETGFNSETTVSRILQLTIVDMLYIGIILQDYDKYSGMLSQLNQLMTDMTY